jgi:hypothetical protein
MIKFFVSEKVFGSSVTFVSNCTHKEFARYLREVYAHKLEEDIGCTGQHVTLIEDSRHEYFIWLEKFDSSPFWIGVVSHEIVHHVVRILKRRGVGIEPNYSNGDTGDEPLAYMHEFYLSEYLTKLNIHLTNNNAKGRNARTSGTKKGRVIPKLPKAGKRRAS